MMIQDVFLLARIIRPYYAVALAALTPISTDKVDTFAVDKYWRLYYSEKFLESRPIEELAIILADHELQHLLRDHAHRSINYADKVKWNMASDMEINDDMETKPKDCLLPKQFGLIDGELAEFYYDKIEFNNNSSGTCSGGSGAGNKQDFELGKDNNSINPQAIDRIKKHVAHEVKKYKKGTIPNSVSMWADKILEQSKLDWRRILSSNIKSKAGKIINGTQDFSYSKMSRRSSKDVVRPGIISRYPKIAVLIDTSGSMYDFGSQVLGHIKKIAESVSNDILYVSGDCEVHEIVKNRKSLKFSGGGGSSLIPLYNDAVKEKVDFCIAITDGDTEYPKEISKDLIVVKLIDKDSVEVFKL